MSKTTTIDLASVRLAQGNHGGRYTGLVCAVECANRIAAGVIVPPPELMPPCPLTPAPFTDDHPSISPVIRQYVIGLNDAWDEETRQRLVPYAARILCTRTTDADEETRAWLATDWLARVHTPAWLRLAGLTEHAQALESLARIVNATTARSAQPALNRARSASAAASAAARAAASAAACAAAWDAAWDAACAAARAAAWDAAWDALLPTVAALQTSALELLDAMLAVGRAG